MTAAPEAVGAQAGTSAPDLRLAFVAAGVWGAVLAVLYLGPGWGIGIAVGAGCAVVVGMQAKRAWLTVVGVIAIGVAAGAVVASAQVVLRDAPPLRGWVAEERVVSARVTVTDDPLRLRGGQRETYRVPVRVTGVRSGPERLDVSARAVVFATDAGRWRWDKVLPGQSLTVRGRLSPAEPGTLNTADIAVGKAPKRHGEPPWWQRAAGFLRSGLRQACAGLPPEPGGLLPGLALGDVSTMDAGVDGDFRDAGMTHLLAVSGSNVAIVVGAAVLLAAGCGAGRRTRVVLGLAVIVGFVVLVRPSPSVLRAAVMGGLGLLVLSRRGGRRAVPILAAAVAMLLLIDPGLATDLGFVLSVVATTGLVFFATRWTTSLRSRGWPPWLAAAVAVPAAAQLAVTPVLAAATGAITPVAVAANALAVIAVAPATVLTVVATVLWPLWPDAATALAWLASWPARWLVTVADHAAQVPSGSLPWPTGLLPGLLLALLLGLGLVLLRWRAGRRFLAVLVLGVLVGVVPVRLLTGGWPPPGWALIACDVGQGDALLLPTGVDSRVIVVDTGPDPRAIDACLRSLGVERVALLAFSHAHADHIGGVTGVYGGRTVEAVLPPLPDTHSPPDPPGTDPHGTGEGTGRPGAAPLGPGGGEAFRPDGIGQCRSGAGPATARSDQAGSSFGAAGGDGRRRPDAGVWSGPTVPPRHVGREDPGRPHGWDGSGRQRFAEAIRETPALTVSVGDSITVGTTRLDVLAPDSAFTGTRSDPNNNSYVLRATVAGTSILLSGDVEEPAQAAVLASGQRLQSDVLKVPHHGSAYFDAAFFEAVAPRLAVVSAGRGNDYGHPHPRTLRQLKRQGTAVLRTDRHGGFAIVEQDGRLAVMTMD